jgi:hypothetical protein
VLGTPASLTPAKRLKFESHRGPSAVSHQLSARSDYSGLQHTIARFARNPGPFDYAQGKLRPGLHVSHFIARFARNPGLQHIR